MLTEAITVVMPPSVRDFALGITITVKAVVYGVVIASKF
jgi:hypothetical protein